MTPKMSAAACAAFVPLFVLATASPVHANLCKSVRDLATTDATARDVAFFEELFPDRADRGDLSWNKIVVQCNRQRDTRGREIAKVTQARGGNAGKRLLLSRDLPPKAIRGRYNFFGTVFTQQKYVYALEKKGGEWIMTIPYRALINDTVKDRIDLNMNHAARFYEASEVEGPARAPALRNGARPITETLCRTSTYFPGKEGAYDGKQL
jgi:hypothetical protein